MHLRKSTPISSSPSTHCSSMRASRRPPSVWGEAPRRSAMPWPSSAKSSPTSCSCAPARGSCRRRRRSSLHPPCTSFSPGWRACSVRASPSILPTPSRDFAMTASEVGDLILLQPLRRRLEALAPSVRVGWMPGQGEETIDALRQGAAISPSTSRRCHCRRRTSACSSSMTTGSHASPVPAIR